MSQLGFQLASTAVHAEIHLVGWACFQEEHLSARAPITSTPGICSRS